jgi:hypothetical protein
MTEEEAKTKWCPFARVSMAWQSSIGSANRGLTEDEKPLANCIGSACMAWRWEGFLRQGSDRKPYLAVTEREAYEARSDVYDNRNVARVGFCGLAGKP